MQRVRSQRRKLYQRTRFGRPAGGQEIQSIEFKAMQGFAQGLLDSGKTKFQVRENLLDRLGF